MERENVGFERLVYTRIYIYIYIYIYMFVYTGIHCLQKNHWPALAGGDHWQWLATVKPAGHHASLAAVWSGGPANQDISDISKYNISRF